MASLPLRNEFFVSLQIVWTRRINYVGYATVEFCLPKVANIAHAHTRIGPLKRQSHRALKRDVQPQEHSLATSNR